MTAIMTITALAPSVISHRLMAAPEAEMSGRDAVDVLHDLLDRVPLPIGR